VFCACGRQLDLGSESVTVDPRLIPSVVGKGGSNFRKVCGHPTSPSSHTFTTATGISLASRSTVILRSYNRVSVMVQLEEDFSVSLDIDRADNAIVVRGLMSQVRSGSHRHALACCRIQPHE
jgi:hypothetical protein